MRFIASAGVAGLALGAALGASAVGTASAAPSGDETIVVTESGDGGLSFNGDPDFDTPFEFTTAASSIGQGSVYVPPIGKNPADKFIAGVGLVDYFFNDGDLGEIADFESFSYDFRIDGEVGPTAYKQFYANVYANGPGSTESFADCVYDFVPTEGSTEGFTELRFGAGTEATGEPRNRTGAYDCGDTIADLEGGQVNYIAVNLGDTSDADKGVGGYFDNFQLATTEGTTTYDLEKAPESKQECKDGNTAGFKNQGECVSSFAKQTNNGKNKG